jgi:acyl-CoA synthetase (AMP-forming)/AMP-acid ligase II
MDLPAATFLPDFLQHRAAEGPDRRCWVFGERTWTWSQAWDSVGHAAGALAAAGVTRGDNVAILDKNNPAILQVLLGGCQIGASTTVVNWRLAGDELDYVLNDCRAEVVFVGHQLLDQFNLVRDNLEHARTIIVIGGPDDEFEAWLAAGPSTDRQPAVVPDDVCVVMYSSGTTGRPKGVQLTQAAMVEHCVNGLGDQVYDQDNDMMMVAMPMFHVGGTSYALLGPVVGVAGYIVPEVDAQLLAAGMMAGCTHAFLVPAVVAALNAAGPQAMGLFSKLKAVGYGAAPMPLPVLRAAMAAWPDTDFQQVYGMTEMCGVITILDDAAHRDKLRPERLVSAGRPVQHAEMRIVDPVALTDVPDGSSGEIWFRTPQATVGYLGKPDATSELFAEDGWLRTGDIGRVDDGGFLFIEDRIKDMIITGGENVYSPEVERALVEHPAVAEVAIIGVPHDTWGETVKAIVAFAPGQSATADELMAFARERLARYKVPTSIDVIGELPRNPSGKILKRDLRKEYWASSDRQV